MDTMRLTNLAPIDYAVRDMVLTDAQDAAYQTADVADGETMRNLLDMRDWRTRLNSRAFIGCEVQS